jgi:hypothetical protein
MGNKCSLCGEFITSIENQQFAQFIKEKIASYGVVSVYDLDDSNLINCEICETSFCIKCWLKRQYNGKSLGKYIEIFDKKFKTLASKTFVTDTYICESCTQKKSSSRCHTCGKSLNQDKESVFSGRHVGMHVKCGHCASLICLDCATKRENPGQYQKNCPFCNKTKWLPIKPELLISHYKRTIIYLNERLGFKCQNCDDEKSIMLICQRQPKCGEIYCPECLLKLDPKQKGTCPSCHKAGFKPYAKELVDLRSRSLSLPPIISGVKTIPLAKLDQVGEEQLTSIEEIIPETPVVDDDELEADFIIDSESSSTSSTIKIDKIDSEIDLAIYQDQKQEESDHLLKFAKLSTELDLELDVDIEEETDLSQQPLNLHEDLRRFVRISNMLDELGEFLESETYSIQFSLQSGEQFYIRILHGKLIGNIGKYPKPTLTSDVLTQEEATHLLHGISDLDFSFLHGDPNLIEHFMDFHEMFDMVVHA